MTLPTSRSHRRLLTCVTVLLLLWVGALHGATTASEDEVRAAFLFQLAQYVHWPARSAGQEASPLRFCVLGQDKLTATLVPTVRDKFIEGRSILVLRLASAKQLPDCDLAFIGFQSEKRIRATLKSWKYPPILLVGEADRFAEMGGIVNLVIRSGRVSFEINLATGERAHLEFRSQLLRFARIVSSATGEKK